MTEAAIHRWERPERASGSRAPAEVVAPPTLFGSVLQPVQARQERGGTWTRAALVALGVHAAALVGVSLGASSGAGPLAPAGSGGVALEVPMTFMTLKAAAAPAPSAQPASQPVAVRPRKSRPAPVLTRPTSALAAKSVPGPEPVEEEGEETASEQAPEGAPEPVVAAVTPGGEGAVGGSGGVLGGVAGGSLAGLGGLGLPSLPPPPPVLTREKREALLSRYLQDIFRLRIAARFHYPAEAEELGLQGLVTVRVSLDGSGRLLGLRVRGACPHPVLCDAALDTVRESVPFPAPPSELGASFDVDVPFQYRLE